VIQTLLTALLGLSVAMHLVAGFWTMGISLSSDHKRTWYVFTAGYVLLALSATWVLAQALLDGNPLNLWVELSRSAAGVFLLIALVPFRSVLAHRRQTVHAYEHLLQTMRDTYYRADQFGNIEVISASCEAIVGYGPEELIGQQLSGFYVDPTARTLLLEALQAGGGAVAGYQALIKHRAGHHVMMENNAQLVYNAAGEVIGVEGVLRNITERLRTEQQNSALGRILEWSANEIYVFDAETRLFVMVNKGARDNVGYTMEELSQLTPTDLRPRESAVPFEELLRSLRQGEQDSVLVDSLIRRKDGSLYPAELTLQYSGASLRPVFFVIVQDMTERKKAAVDLARAQRLQSVGQLTGGIAHDFNNMLQALQLSLERLKPATPDQVPWHDGALRVVHQASQLTQRLLAFARHQTLLPQVVDVGKTLVGMEMLLQLTLKGRVKLGLDLSPAALLIEVDEAQFENGLLNLVLNARDAMPDGGQICIRSQTLQLTADQGQRLDNLAAGDYVEISVEDNGKGMPEQVAEKAFEPFFTTKQVGEGNGMGLSMVYGFVKQSGGHMILSSTLGQGTTVRLYFPVTNKAPQIATNKPVVEAGGGTEMILLVEDDEVVRMLAAGLLAEMGYRVVVAADGSAAEQMASQHAGRLDLVISDVLLSGGESGPATVARIKAIHGPVKTIFISGHTRQYWSAGEVFPDDSVFLHKPFTTEQLDSAIRQLLGP
jgi:PAS domain S-box-containing protein